MAGLAAASLLLALGTGLVGIGVLWRRRRARGLVIALEVACLFGSALLLALPIGANHGPVSLMVNVCCRSRSSCWCARKVRRFPREPMLYVGTSGWQYAHWRRVFYPEKLAAACVAALLRRAFPDRRGEQHVLQPAREVGLRAVEPEQPSDDFVFALKMSRYLTHLKRLHDPAEPVHRFMDRARALGPKLGPVLIQLPPRFRDQPRAARRDAGCCSTVTCGSR